MRYAFGSRRARGCSQAASPRAVRRRPRGRRGVRRVQQSIRGLCRRLGRGLGLPRRSAAPVRGCRAETGHALRRGRRHRQRVDGRRCAVRRADVRPRAQRQKPQLLAAVSLRPAVRSRSGHAHQRRPQRRTAAAARPQREHDLARAQDVRRLDDQHLPHRPAHLHDRSLLRRREDRHAPDRSAVDGVPQPYSLGRTQMAWWFFLVVLSYTYIWLCLGDRDTIPTSVLGLMGIISATALAAMFITPKNAAPRNTEDFWRDLAAYDQGTIALDRLQIVVWTLILSGIFLTSVIWELTMPEFSATLLALMGISSGTYIGFQFPQAKSAAPS